MSDITVTFSKDRYIFGEDTSIEGKITINRDASSEFEGNIEVKHIIKEWVFEKVINADTLDELLKPASFFAIKNPFKTINTYTISILKLKKNEYNFQFDITTPNFYGDMWVWPWDGNYSCIINYIVITLDQNGISETLPVRIEWDNVQPVLLKKEKEKEILDEDTFDEEEEKFDESKWIKLLWWERLISQSAYDDVSSLSIIEKIGKMLYELKVFWILYRTLCIGAFPFFIFSLSEVLVTFIPAFTISNIDNFYTWVVVFFLILRFYFVSSFKKKIEKRSVSIDIFEPDEDEEKYFRKCFEWNQLKLEKLFEPDFGDPLYPLSISGKCEIWIELLYDYRISKHYSFQQTIINKKIFSGTFSSLSSLMNKEIVLEKWVNDIARLQNEHGKLTCEVIVDITYTWLTKERETIDLIWY